MKKTLKLLIATPLCVIYIVATILSVILTIPAKALKMLARLIETNFFTFKN